MYLLSLSIVICHLIISVLLLLLFASVCKFMLLQAKVLYYIHYGATIVHSDCSSSCVIHDSVRYVLH